jgi:hypothetical protein
MDMLYVLATALGTSLVFASVVWAILPEMPMWLVSVLFAVAFPVLFPIFIISRILVELVTRFFGPRSFPDLRMTKKEAMAMAAQERTKAGINRSIDWVSAQRTDGRLAWIAGMTFIGGGPTVPTVHIDDATGQVSVIHWPLNDGGS